MTSNTCSNCGGSELYQSEPIGAGGGYAPNYLPGLGKWFQAAQFHLVMCRQCGLTLFFASAEATEKLKDSDHWNRLT